MSLALKNAIVSQITSALRCGPPEFAHNFALGMLRVLGNQARYLVPNAQEMADLIATLAYELKGIGGIAHPIGLAAGFDKDAVALSGLSALGFSFLEVGTVTPLAQNGNPKPRLFRLKSQRALINRMGFNNSGMEAMAQTLSQALPRVAIPVGINLGKNKDTPLEQAVLDYAKLLEHLKPFGQYFVINISSPNTPGLRALARPEFIKELARIALGQKQKIWIKLDPDLDKKTLQQLVQIIAAEEFAGVILINTHRVEKPQAGGMSGVPLNSLACQALEFAWEVHKGSLPMISVGGISCGLDVYQRILRGAQAVQIYTAFIYQGPFVIYNLLSQLKQEMNLRGVVSLDEIRGGFYRA